MMNNQIIGISGLGQHHSNKNGDNPYIELTLNDIYKLVDDPQEVDKTQSQWLIPSIHHSRVFKEQEQHGQYHLLWCDFDEKPLPIEEVADIADNLDCDYEVYTSRGATQDNQKSRLLIPLDEPLCVGDWKLSQEALNDYFLQHGVTPDRANERSAQLCFLPNKGNYYASINERDSWRFDPMDHFKDEIQTKRKAIDAAQEAARKRIEESRAKREQRLAEGFKSPIDAFNAAYTVEDILIQAGYEQRGDSFRHPDSESGSYSASVKGGRVKTLSPNDPLYCGEGAHDAFSAFEVLFHSKDRNAALKDAGDNWLKVSGESWNAVSQQEYREKQALEAFNDMFPQKDNEVEKSPLELLQSFSVTGQSEAMKQKMLDDAFAFKGLAIVGQWTTFYAAPNTGKTLLTLWLITEQIKAGELNGEDVFYVNVDDTYKGGVQKTEIAEKHGFHMLLPDQNGFKKEVLLNVLSKMVEKDQARGKIVILDTLKKFTNLMDKTTASQFGDQCRRFVAAGGTVICLAHVNKRKDDEGKSVFSGTSDIVDDNDCAYVIELVGKNTIEANETKTTVEFNNIKARGDVADKATFQYTNKAGGEYHTLVDSVRRLGEDEIQQAKELAEIEAGHDKDADVIDTIIRLIGKDKPIKTDLAKQAIEETGATRRKVNEVLKRWEGSNYHKGHLWQVVKEDKNTHHYILTEHPLAKILSGDTS